MYQDNIGEVISTISMQPLDLSSDIQMYTTASTTAPPNTCSQGFGIGSYRPSSVPSTGGYSTIAATCLYNDPMWDQNILTDSKPVIRQASQYIQIAPQHPNMMRRPHAVGLSQPKLLPDERLSEHELRKRQQRRERNKLAAARCRQRRVELTNSLQEQTEELEEEKHAKQRLIGQLRKQKEELEAALATHRALCPKRFEQSDVIVKEEPKEADEEDMSAVLNFKRPSLLQFTDLKNAIKCEAGKESESSSTSVSRPAALFTQTPTSTVNTPTISFPTPTFSFSSTVTTGDDIWNNNVPVTSCSLGGKNKNGNGISSINLQAPCATQYRRQSSSGSGSDGSLHSPNMCY